MRILEINFSEIHKVSSSKGIYAWYLKLTENELKDQYSNFYRSSVLKSIIKGNLKFRFEGEIKMIDYKSNVESINPKILESISKMVASPLYIGISKDLNKRLMTHYDQLIEFRYSESSEIIDEISEFDLDGLQESKYFAQRVATHLKKHNLNVKDLFIRYVNFNDDISLIDIRNSETYFNRVFNPILGRK